MGEQDELLREVVEALREAREMVSSWGAYASTYFQEKHDLEGDIAQLDAMIAKAEAALDPNG